MEHRRPLLVLVSGAPGSGKSTLARRLGDRLYLPVADKDRLRDGKLATVGRDASRADAPGHTLFFATVERWLQLGMSCVGDMTFVRGLSEPDVAAHFAPHAELVNVH